MHFKVVMMVSRKPADILIEVSGGQPDRRCRHSKPMETKAPTRPTALVLANNAGNMAPNNASLRRQGYTVRFFDNANDALTVFGVDMPVRAIIGPIVLTPCLQLLLEDLDRYGIPTERSAVSRGRVPGLVARKSPRSPEIFGKRA